MKTVLLGFQPRSLDGEFVELLGDDLKVRVRDRLIQADETSPSATCSPSRTWISLMMPPVGCWIFLP